MFPCPILYLITWTLLGTFDFIDQNSKMVARKERELFIGGFNGVWFTRNGTDFYLVDS